MSLLSPNITAQVFEGSVSWDRSTRLHIDTFLRLYTLHDSVWIGMNINCAWEDTAIAAFRFDPVWNPSVSAPTSLIAEWPFLFLKFSCVNMIRLSGFRANANLQRDISSAASDLLSANEVVTTLGDHYGALVSIQHFPLIEVLAISADGLVIDLPNSSI